MAGIRDLLWNPEEARPRAGVRMVVFLIVTFVLSEGLSTLQVVLGRLLPSIYGAAIAAALYLLLIGVVLLLASRILDHRPIADYGFHLRREWWMDLAFGLVLGTLLLLGIYVLELAMGWIKVTGTLAAAPGQPFAATILVGLLAAVAISVGEEVIWRGYSVKNLAEGFNSRVIGARWATVIAILIPSALFGLSHATNPSATTLSTMNVVVFGLLFGVGYVLTGELALPIGLHFAWDFVQGFVFGVTGLTLQLGSFLVVAEGDSPERLWTGLPYGVEGGPLATGAFVLGFLLIGAWVRLRRGTLRPHPSLAQPPARPQPA
jgi:membrane protease YdiL (CAAX protease family)